MSAGSMVPVRELARSNSLVRDYGLSDGNVLHLVLRLSDLQVINVSTCCGKEFTFHVERSQDVGYVKRQIAKRKSELMEDHEVLLNGKPIEDQRLINDISKNNTDAVIHLFNDIRECDVEKKSGYEGDSVSEHNIHVPTKVPVFGGYWGAYLMLDKSGTEYVSVFKPVDEEPMAVNNPRGLPLSEDGEGLKKGTRVGEGAIRECAVYLLDHPKSGGARFLSGSLQMFMENNGSCEDMGLSAFPVQEVHKIAVLDIRMANADRHAGNILVSKGEDGQTVLIPIDHGYCLPYSFEDCTFDWLYWPQARQPFSTETIEYINSMDAENDIALLKFYGWEIPLECARVLRISTMLLKKVRTESVIEEIVQEAQDSVLPGSSEDTFLDAVSSFMDRRLEEII
ncbi:hypothetical protein DH2020_029175 [Rehmannia glutinosa]|uniref:1-phosphatidylinositol 4-kinase n=1 Tax=Rehmannia glutinosa TaxID=99300 RepID=A0ABR0VSZ8_REHGL